ncbi:PPC domain-containing protein [Candidatus Aciduliprofundum boonei]|uniref:Peptidase domain protein n=1 Tax=Aciduliprofundum boonei (strain DSM 19572 / T469) TaxID=439481 RepID=B5I9G1_ACIB4|nr:PPC domain-containing protein [Candidatus Aciduliprofundum boonei]ADD08570.1 peptidase domain protein [Aciduliprofundum boonei T469]EDY37044.1 Bacterial pre-peptidase C-terminal domain family [Aciduliprofundum boonei T469]HII55751.1 peptidase [Candidatus Aciduliprofundum boonei]
MRAAKILVTTIAAAMIFTGFFAIFAAAEGTSFDDAKVIGQGTYSGMVTSDYYYKVNVPAYKAILVTLTAGNNAWVSLQIYNNERQDVGLWGHASANDGEKDYAFYDGKSVTSYAVYIKISNLHFFTSSNYTIQIEFRPGDVMAGAQEIEPGKNISGMLKGSLEAHWYKINVPPYKALLVTLTAKSNSEIELELYNKNRESIGSPAYAENGGSDTTFYDAKSTSSYTVYLRIANSKLSEYSGYTLRAEFRPGDVMAGAQGISNGQTISDEIKCSFEAHWYKINVPKGKLLNVSFTSNGGEIDVTLYNSAGNVVDWKYGTKGYVNTETLGESGTIYIKVTAYEYHNTVNYTITPHLKTGSSDVEQMSNVIATTCLGGIIIAIVIIVLIIILIVKVSRGKKEKTQIQQPPKTP